MSQVRVYSYVARQGGDNLFLCIQLTGEISLGVARLCDVKVMLYWFGGNCALHFPPCFAGGEVRVYRAQCPVEQRDYFTVAAMQSADLSSWLL
ncbi:hypothetical protein FKM82_028493 [Ascaphus truei]